MKKIRQYCEGATELDIEFFGWKRDKKGRAYYEKEVYTKDEQKRVRVMRNREAFRETPNKIKVQLGIRI